MTLSLVALSSHFFTFLLASSCTYTTQDRNARRAKLERERYQRLTPEELEAKNRKRRERAAMARSKKALDRSDGSVTGTGDGTDNNIDGQPPSSVDADTSSRPHDASDDHNDGIKDESGPDDGVVAAAAAAAAASNVQEGEGSYQAAVDAAVEAVENSVPVSI